MAIIDNLANEILGLCFDGCSLRQLVRYSEVSRRWRGAAHAHPLFWKSVELRHPHRDGGTSLFVERLNASSGHGIAVTLLYCDSRAVQAVVNNMPRITSLTLGRDELRILSLFVFPAPELRTLNLCGGLFSSAQHPVGQSGASNVLAASRFLGGQAPNLNSVSLNNCSFLFWESNVVPFPSVTRVSVSLTGTQRRFFSIGYSIQVLFNSLAALFPNVRALTYNLDYINCSSRPITLEMPPSWTTAEFAQATMQWLQLLIEFAAHDHAIFYLGHIPVSKIPHVSFRLPAKERLAWLRHPALALGALVPPEIFVALTFYGNEREEVALSTLSGVRRRVYGPTHNATSPAMDLDWFVGAAQGRLIAWSTDAAWFCRCSLSLPQRVVFTALKVLVIDINAWESITMPVIPTDRRLECPNIRRIILYTRRAEPPNHVVLPWTFFNRLMSFFNPPLGVTLELRGVRMLDSDPFIGTDDVPARFANVILDENDAVLGTGTDWFLDLRRALAAV